MKTRVSLELSAEALAYYRRVAALQGEALLSALEVTLENQAKNHKNLRAQAACEAYAAKLRAKRG